jgi:site-specific DNA-methyltransferase (adenine-specific)
MNNIPVSHVENIDCIDFMKKFPDKYFDLAIVDPPYGINHSEIAGKQSGKKYGKAAAAKAVYATKDWDKSIPEPEYFEQLKRVSKNQIIWGANYMVEFLNASMGWIVWDKVNGNNGFSDCELAYSSFEKGLRKFTYMWNGMLQGNMKNKEERIHPTQKPVALYHWLLQNYAKSGDKILDTHLGGGSHRIAAYKLGFDFYAAEIDSDYYKAQEERFQKATYEPLFTAIKIEQQNLFNDAA